MSWTDWLKTVIARLPPRLAPLAQHGTGKEYLRQLWESGACPAAGVELLPKFLAEEDGP